MPQVNYLREAKILFASGKLVECIETFSLAEAEGANIIDTCMSRGAARVALGKYAEAIDDFTRVLEEGGNDERAYYYRGIANAALRQFDKAVEDLTQSLIRNNDRGIAHLVRGLAFAEMGRETDAVLDINSASAFSEAEIRSFANVFGSGKSPFSNASAILTEENAPWKNLLTDEAAAKLRTFLQ